jgi:phage terminase small subunit
MAKQRKHKKPATGNKKGELTMKQKMFCREYIYDWNATRSYLIAYPNTKNRNSAAVLANRLLRKVNIKAHIEEIQKDLEKIAGVSRLMIATEHLKIAKSTIAHLHNTWIERKEFEALTEDQKACIQEIDTKVVRTYKREIIDGVREKIPYDTEYVKIKLYDKQKALESLSKMFGYEAVQKMEITGKDGKDLFSSLTDEELDERVKRIVGIYNG